MRRSIAVLATASLLAAAPDVRAARQAGSFQIGDVYLASRSLDVGGAAQAGVLRADPFTGATHLVAQFLDIRRAAAHDAYRDRIVLGALGPGLLLNGEIVLVDAAGGVQKLGVSAANLGGVAPTGDGRIYFAENGHDLRYLDGANVAHDLLDAAGAAPFTFSSGTFGAAQMHFDAATNSLFIGTQGPSAPCGGAIAQITFVHRVPLSVDGTRVGGPIQSAPVCLEAGGTDNVPNGFSAGPAGSIFLSVDDNSSSTLGRMVTIDAATLAITTFASNGPYIGCAATNAATYSAILQRAVILDTFNDVLRLFAAGESGAGTTWIAGHGVSSGGSGEFATLLEITAGAAAGLAPYGTGTPGCSGAIVLGATSAPIVGAANFRFTCSNAPASALGLLVVGNVPDLLGSDPLGLGIVFHVNLFLSTFLDGLDLNSNGLGVAESPAPIPIVASLAGQTIDAQAIWLFTGCATPSPFGLASSNGLAVTF